MLKPDPTRYPSIVQTRSAGPEWVESDSEDSKRGSSDATVFPGRADLPTDLALDLRLHEILQQARLATGASGAVIALARGDKMICRATLGDKAPSAGVCLNTRSGLAGACVQTREMQLCDDALADPRVNVIACRDLGIRSIVVLPVLDGGELWGVFEVFSAIPRAFSDSDLQALQSISRKISHTVREAIEGGSSGLVLESFSSPPAQEAESGDKVWVEPAQLAPDSQNETVPDEPVVNETVVHEGVPGRDYRTGALTAAVLALAVLLGWMVGRVGWTLAVNRAPAPIPMAQDDAPATAQATPAPRPAPPRQETPEETKGDAKTPPTPVRSTSLPPAAKPRSKPKAEATKPVELNGGLVVYEHGKVVFRSSPSQPESPSKAEPAVAASDAVQQAAARENDGAGATQPASSPTANNYLLARVEPEYPEAARQQHIEGPVVLDVLVGADGLVRELSVISGDPQLAKAATDAVRQWRFNPHQLKGKAVEFETQITVNFALPK
jgi:TonB family protein